MNNLYWMGIRESEIEFCKDMFKDSITIFGNTNISMQRKLNKVIDHNNVENFETVEKVPIIRNQFIEMCREETKLSRKKIENFLKMLAEST